MERVVTVSEMRDQEKYIMDMCRLPASTLMERAAFFAYESAACRFEKPGRAVLFCGFGNNGGDGIALARILYEHGWTCTIIMVGNDKKQTAENRHQIDVLKAVYPKCRIEAFNNVFGEEARPFMAFDNVDLIVDAMLGIGLTRALEGDFKKAVSVINGLDVFTVSLDIPTGLDADTGKSLNECVKADMTVTFGAVKAGLMLCGGRIAAGEIKADTCGIYHTGDSDAYDCSTGAYLEETDLKKLLKRDPQGNKGTFGKLFLWAGSKETGGAAILSARAAFLSGTGYIRMLSHMINRDSVLKALPECVFSGYEDNGSGIDDHLAKGVDFADVIAAGCGVGNNKESLIIFRKLMKMIKDKEKKPVLILDADILRMISGNDMWNELSDAGCSIVMTPHMGEFSAMTGKSISEIRDDRINIARSFAAEKNIILVLKDSETLVMSQSGRYMIYNGGNDGMAVAGSGDTLLGIIAACICNAEDPFKGAGAGVYIHGMAGGIAAADKSRYSMLPSDIADRLPEVFLNVQG